MFRVSLLQLDVNNHVNKNRDNRDSLVFNELRLKYKISKYGVSDGVPDCVLLNSFYK